MIDNINNKKIRTLEPKKPFIVNDINIKEYNLTSVSTVILLSIMFLISLKIVVISGI